MKLVEVLESAGRMVRTLKVPTEAGGTAIVLAGSQVEGSEAGQLAELALNMQSS